MTRYDGRDRYVDPQTGVLLNKLGITDADTLRRAEASLAAWRSFELAIGPISGNFDFAHLQAIHARLFGDLYPWAGELRDVDLSKGDCRFANCRHLLTAGEALFAQLRREDALRGLDASHFSERAGYYLGEINALHPFRDGNGRAQREFVSQLARQNGWRVAWENADEAAMIEASRRSLLHGDASGLARIIEENLRRLPGRLDKAPGER
ncbi:MAG: Fic/DOC family protein [Acidobacteriota bacterium]